MSRKRFIAGNWKMNGSLESNQELVKELLSSVDADNVDIVVFPPALYLSQIASLIEGTSIKLGVQNISTKTSGAYTGEISAEMVKDFDCYYVMVGHSERRELFGETNGDVVKKIQQTLDSGLIPVLCVGETEDERERGETEKVVKEQLIAVIDALGIAVLRNMVVAYEPVWAIGTGKSATPEEANSVHEIIRCTFSEYDANIAGFIRIVYGGSVNASNCKELFEQKEIDGALVGGASLKAKDFSEIVNI